MRIFDQNTLIYDELISLLRFKARLEKQRNIDPDLKEEIEDQVETVDQTNLKILQKKCLSDDLSMIIKLGISNRLLTAIPNGAILLQDYMQICGLTHDQAIETLTFESFIFTKIETRGRRKESLRSKTKFDTSQTLILPPPKLHEAILQDKVIYHITTSCKDQREDSVPEQNLFEEIIKIDTLYTSSILGAW